MVKRLEPRGAADAAACTSWEHEVVGRRTPRRNRPIDCSSLAKQFVQVAGGFWWLPHPCRYEWAMSVGVLLIGSYGVRLASRPV